MSENDDRLAWWHGLNEEDRAFWLDQAGRSDPIASVAAWNAWKCALPDALAGLTWWHSLDAAERRHWRTLAGSLRPIDAWQAYKAVLEAGFRGEFSRMLQDGGPQRLASDAARTGGTTGSRDVT